MSRPTQDGLGAAVMVLIVLTGVMLLALFTRTPPHPPLEVALFALAPFLGASLALGVAALWQIHAKSGLWLALAFAATALVSYGPQKYFDPTFASIWPAVMLAQAAIIAVLYLSAGRLKSRKT